MRTRPKENQSNFKRAAVELSQTLPYLQEPYSRRAWGNGLHSLCSYQGKLKPSIAHFLVKFFTNSGDRVLDPMSGCGTIPLEAFLQGRHAMGNDLQELGYILTRAKVQTGLESEVASVLKDILQHIEKRKNKQNLSRYDTFGFNGKIPEYFDEMTLREVLAAREYLKLNPCRSWGQAIVYSSLLHILHGNRPYALSRRSHSVIPLKPSGEFDYRGLAPRLKAKMERTLACSIPEHVLAGTATQLPYSELPYDNEIDVVITSPPFAASTRFYVSNWMRLWLSGWEPQDFKTRPKQFLEYQQKKSMDAYIEFFNCCGRWLRPNGKLIMHVGKTKACNMAEELIMRAEDKFELVYFFDEDVTSREKFGIKDQGATTLHQYLFFRLID